MACGLGRKLLKLIFWIINFSIWAVSIVLIALGSWIIADSDNFDSLFSEDKITPIAGIILGLGCFCFLVGFCGCRGAMLVDDGRGAIYLKVYFFLMLIVVIGQLVCGILMIVYSDDVTGWMEEGMTETIKDDYGETDAATDSVDFMQKDNKCCGATNKEDYDGSTWEAKAINNGKVPGSCCGTDELRCDPADAYDVGCVESYGQSLEDNILVVGGVCIGIIGVEIIALMISCCLIDDIDKEGVA